MLNNLLYKKLLFKKIIQLSDLFQMLNVNYFGDY